MGDLQDMRWTSKRGPGRPCNRWGHCMTKVDGGILVFGGLNSKYNLGDAWLFNTDDWTCSSLEIYGNSPGVCGYSTMVSIRGAAVLFGGLYCAGGPYEYNNN